MDKLPMLVPPAATKTPFYKNRLLAAQWAQAAEALRGAEELVLMGYSVPVTDLTVRTLIATQFRGRTIVPVNQDPDVVICHPLRVIARYWKPAAAVRMLYGQMRALVR
jgi:hypothetical protein